MTTQRRTLSRPNIANFPAPSHIPDHIHVVSASRRAINSRPNTQPSLFDFVSPRFPRDSTAEKPPAWSPAPLGCDVLHGFPVAYN
ncbi:uncharacterized protein LY79DRAFT_268835 [Colletotrichum navitas]|uniref:Uncharacterized protein n=1 Tax=Colletotrichum navitas TaxID=681940 RepID=A0AAD8PVH4_9PEZI|nr:uncharacterized protein LY79DRAFT_268835 [Colletotrichum navitas]KAK1585469.1 hypothetical protein LY79DRAFT_268835 [Colletotrichum navitas]